MIRREAFHAPLLTRLTPGAQKCTCSGKGGAQKCTFPLMGPVLTSRQVHKSAPPAVFLAERMKTKTKKVHLCAPVLWIAISERGGEGWGLANDGAQNI